MNDDPVNKMVELTNDIAEKRFAFFRHLLLIATTLFGILISLSSKSYTQPYIRVSFAVSILLLSIGILALALSSYSEIEYRIRGRESYRKEALSAAREGREPVWVDEQPIKFYVRSEKVAYIFLSLSILSLAIYTVLIALS
jgi:hypothetical protein